jgi:hypothetical protein
MCICGMIMMREYRKDVIIPQTHIGNRRVLLSHDCAALLTTKDNTNTI